VAQFIGHGDGGFAEPIIRAFDASVASGNRSLLVFFDLGEMPDYDSPLRTRLTTHFVRERARFQSFDVLTRSRIVAMGVSVANLALGGLIASHSDRAAFLSAVDSAVAQTKVTGFSSSMLTRGAAAAV
jgi:hypothetical protein